MQEIHIVVNIRAIYKTISSRVCKTNDSDGFRLKFSVDIIRIAKRKRKKLL